MDLSNRKMKMQYKKIGSTWQDMTIHRLFLTAQTNKELAPEKIRATHLWDEVLTAKSLILGSEWGYIREGAQPFWHYYSDLQEWISLKLLYQEIDIS